MEEATSASAARSFWMFFAKTAAVLPLVAIFLALVLPDAGQIVGQIKSELYRPLVKVRKNLQKELKREQAKLYFLSFVQNPAALYKTSEIEEREDKLSNAIRDMELAIGLLEMHGADKQVLRRYYSRLEKLNAGAKGQK